MTGMFDRLDSVKARFDELERKLSEPGATDDARAYAELARERASIEETVRTYDRYRDIERQIAETTEMLDQEQDPEMKEFLSSEKVELKKELERLILALQVLLLPRDELADKDAIVEIRAGTGGEEAALFAGDLLRMYTRFAERNRWKMEMLSSSPSDVGGFKEAIFSLKGKAVYPTMKYESGVHRVQRVPVTESGGRIHTSTATVAVLPEAEDVDVKIEPGDLKVDVFRSTGPGGQSVNTTDSAVRVTHKPTGMVVSCQDEKSQLQNKEKALRILKARLLEEEIRRRQEEEAATRRKQVGTGERSEKIRTYNFPQNRVTDHRIGLTLHRLDAILDGDLDEMIATLRDDEREQALKQVGTA
jgi:peptide chain release factor 1